MKTKLVLGLSLLTLLTSQNAAHAATRTWSGLGGNVFWNNTNNWIGHVRPAGTDDVVFAAATPQMATTNNWIGALHSITFGVGGYSISGNALVLTNGINATNATGQNVIVPAIILGANQSFTNVNAHASLLLLVLDLKGHAATFRGAGTNHIGISGSISDSVGGASLTNAGTGVFQLSGTNNSFTGPTVLTAGTNLINSFHRRSPITWTEGTLGGTGQLGQVTASGFSPNGKTLMPGFGDTGILTTSNLVLNSQVTNIARVNGFIPGVDYDQIVVSNGNVTLSNAELNVSLLPTLTGSFGDTITLISVLNPTNTVSGKFRNVDEGDVYVNDAYFYKFSYAGGDGNDVTLSVVGRTSTGNTRTWGGGGTNNLWSNTNNWSLGVAPALGDAVTFPHTASRRTNVNDFPAEFTFESLSFTAPSGATLNYSLSGNTLRLDNGVRLLPTTFASDVAGAVVISNDLVFNSFLTFTNGLDADLHLAGKLDTAFHTLVANPRAGAEIFFDGPITGSGGLNVGTLGGGSSSGVVHLGGSNSISQINIVSGMVIATHAQALESPFDDIPHFVQSGTLRLQASNAVFTGPVISIKSRLELVPAPNAALAAPLSITGSNTIVILTNLFGVATNFTLQAGVTNSTLLTNAAGGGTLHIGPTATVAGGGIFRNLGTLDVDGIVHNILLLGSTLQNGTLSGTGQIDTVFSTNVGTIAPGSATDAAKALDPLTIGRLVLGNNNGSLVEMELFPNRPGGGATNDQIIVSNAPTLGSATLKLNALASLAPNEQFTILRNLSAARVTNSFTDGGGHILTEGAFIGASNGQLGLRISYVGGDGNDIVLTVQSNTPPTFVVSTNNLTVNELATLTYTNAITDIEQAPQSFTWTLLTPISGMTLNSTNGVLTWTPTEAQGPSTNTVLVKVTDSGTPSMSSTGTVIIIVNETNLAPAALTWSGAGANAFWTNAANWVGNVAPTNGDSLVFPANATRLVNTNTAGGPTSLASITFRGSNYVIYSPPLRLFVGLTNLPPTLRSNRLEAAIALGGDQAWTIANALTLASNLDLSTFHLTLNGSGNFDVSGNITGSAGSQLVLNGGALKLIGLANDVPDLSVINGGFLVVDGVLSGGLSIDLGARLQGHGTVPAFMCAGSFIPGGSFSPGGMTVSSGQAVFTSGSDFQADLFGSTNPGINYDQLKVSTPPHLSGADLFVTPSYSAAVGETFVIITNTGVAPFTTTFRGLPEGSIYVIRTPANEFRISYVGGDGNDVTLKRVPLGTATAPRLAIQLVSTNAVRLLWPTNPPGFSLECNTNVAETNWLPATPSPAVAGTNNVVTNGTSEAKFYRLKK